MESVLPSFQLPVTDFILIVFVMDLIHKHPRGFEKKVLGWRFGVTDLILIVFFPKLRS